MWKLVTGRRRAHPGKPVPEDRTVPTGRGATFARAAIVLLCAWFVFAGIVMIPYPGIQNDEALFAEGIYPPVSVEYTASVFKHHVPVMLMTYIGALKIWLYWLIFGLWAPSVYSLRLPVLLITAGSLAFSYLLMRRIMGTAAALAGSALLATDAVFLMTGVCDWGPVAIQHLMLTGGCLALVRFHQSGRKLLLSLGFLAFGLGLWDKALFIWLLAALGVAALVVVPRKVFGHISARNVAIALLSFSLGAAPLIRYNISKHLKTFAANTHYSAEGFMGKVAALEATLDGHSLLGYLAPDQASASPGRPRNAIERASIALSEITGGQWKGYGSWALTGSILLLPFAGRLRRVGLFALVFCIVTWLQMALNENTGGGAHHIVLMWPFPQILIAAGFIGAAERIGRAGLAVAGALIGIVCFFNVLVLNQHLYGFVRGGTTLIWTDAINPLSAELMRQPDRKFYVLDWGMLNSLRLLGRGRLSLEPQDGYFQDGQVTDSERPGVLGMFENPRATFVSHVPGNMVFANVQPCFDAELGKQGYRKENVRIVTDRSGRPIFTVFTVGREPRP